MKDTYSDLRKDHVHTPVRFLTLRQVTNMVGVSRSTIYANIHDQKLPFPKPVHIGRRSVWIESEIAHYMRSVVIHSRSAN